MTETKAAGAYLNISEASRRLGVPAYVLRFWEKSFSQVKPKKHLGGRRYYDEPTLVLLEQIRDYLYKHKYTIEGVKRILSKKEQPEEFGGMQAQMEADLLQIQTQLMPYVKKQS
ncbi:MAG: MerR family transcriptional regulator [Alphaproteobacteria bacterium]|nr:MerR family transcriptional regulator [Alphaproteobacteria bacterium]